MTLDKGKGKALPEADSDSDTDSEEITTEYLESLLEKARQNARAKKQKVREEEFMKLDDGPNSAAKLPPLDPGKLPPAYFALNHAGPSSIRDPEIERTKETTILVPAPPIPPPEITKSGKPLTKREKAALKKQTAGPDWFDLPAPSEADLPRLYREVEALRLRNQLDPKRFYRKDEGEAKGIKGLPKYFAIGTVVPSSTPFGTASSDNLTRAERKRTLVDELVDDAESRRYAKKKFDELQSVRGARGRGTWTKKKALRKGKW